MKIVNKRELESLIVNSNYFDTIVIHESSSPLVGISTLECDIVRLPADDQYNFECDGEIEYDLSLEEIVSRFDIDSFPLEYHVEAVA
jgi:hypothetical protein